MYLTLFKEFLKSSFSKNLPDQCLDNIYHNLRKQEIMYKAFVF